MRAVVIKTFIAVWLAVSLPAVAQSPNPPFAISISAVNPEVKAGDEVFIRIVLTNTSQAEVNCSSGYASGVNRSYRYMIQDERGKVINKVIRKHPEIDTPTSVVLCTLNPGQSVTTHSRVGQDYDLKHPGKYVIQISRPISDKKGDEVVTSNKITINIIQ